MRQYEIHTKENPTMTFRLTLTALTLSLLLPAAAGAQLRKNRTELERFHSEKGSIVIMETQPIGYSMLRMDPDVYASFWAVVLYMPGRDDKVIKGIKITIHNRKSRELITTAYIDSTEIPSLYAAMMYIMKAETKLKTEKKDLRVVYMTKGDFSIGYHQKANGESIYYYRISDTVNGKPVTYGFKADVALIKSMKTHIRRGVKWLNKHHKKIRKPDRPEDTQKELNT